jgi:hypothetical protein
LIFLANGPKYGNLNDWGFVMGWTVSQLSDFIGRGGRVAASSLADAKVLLASECGRRDAKKTCAKQAFGGRRDDLGGRYFRSRWEANYARFLNFRQARGEISGWEYEPKEFEFPGVKRGCMRYKPDFRVILLDGSHVWHEVKGWMDAKSGTRMKRMAKFFPEEEVVIIDAPWFKSAGKLLSGVVPGWEFGPGVES